MFQRQLYIYLMLAMSITLNLFQLPGSHVTAVTRVQARPLSIPVLEQSVPPSPAPAGTASIIAPAPLKENYEIDVVMDYERHFVTVEETITYLNRTGLTLDSITLAVAPNLIADCFDLIRLSVDHS